MSDKAWGGRFEEELDAIAARFSASVDVDGRLWPQDIDGSIAHVRMLADQSILSADDAKQIVAGLETIRASIERGEFDWDESQEDVHMNIEAALTSAIGDAGGRLHTGRSRNDQVATDMRLWARQACGSIVADIDTLLDVLADKADGHLDFLMPGYTHLQRAQPVRLAHHLLAWAEMLERDRGRLVDAARRMNESPLGSAALAGTTFPVDREATAHALGFDQPMRNSLDAVSSRDFLLEAVGALAICSVHLSRIAEELVLWSSQEFAFVQMSDAFTTGSSIMPQKKNPDMPELVRGKTGRGHRLARQPVGDAQGTAARVQPGPPRGQSARLRGVRYGTRLPGGARRCHRLREVRQGPNGRRLAGRLPRRDRGRGLARLAWGPVPGRAPRRGQARPPGRAGGQDAR